MNPCFVPLQLGSKYGTWLLERGLTPRYGYMGTVKEGLSSYGMNRISLVNLSRCFIGCGGLWEQIPYQGLDSPCMSEMPLALHFLKKMTLFSFSDPGQDQTVVGINANVSGLPSF